MRILVLALASTLGACAAAVSDPVQDQSWVWILTGPQDDAVQGDARQTAFVGHFANMTRLAEAGDLLLAGPLGEPLVQPDHRGIFLLATADAARARSIADTDPAAQAGIFVFEVESFRTSDRLSLIPGMHQRALASAGQAELPPGFHARPYVLLTGAPARAAEAALDPHGAGVLFSGRLGAGAEERALYCLDARTPAEVRARLDALPSGGVEWVVMPWFATEELTRLRTASR